MLLCFMKSLISFEKSDIVLMHYTCPSTLLIIKKYLYKYIICALKLGLVLLQPHECNNRHFWYTTLIPVCKYHIKCRQYIYINTVDEVSGHLDVWSCDNDINLGPCCSPERVSENVTGGMFTRNIQCGDISLNGGFVSCRNQNGTVRMGYCTY